MYKGIQNNFVEIALFFGQEWQNHQFGHRDVKTYIMTIKTLTIFKVIT